MNTEKDKSEALNKTNVKCRFFAQYYGQDILRFDTGNVKYSIDYKDFPINEKDYIELKSIADITEEDKNVIEESILGFVDKIYNVGKFLFIETKSSISEKPITTSLNSYHFDYLRSKGYALPFMEYSVDDLVKMGWVKLV